MEGLYSTMVNEEVQCVICGRMRPRAQCKIIKPDIKERDAIRELGQEPKPEYTYCRPCWRNITDPTTGPAFMKSLFEVLLSRGGVQNSEKIATKFHVWLVEQARKPRA